MVYYSSIYKMYTWKALLDFYAAFVRQIEIGTKNDDPADLEVPLLSKHVKQEFNKKPSNIAFKKEFKTPAMWFCAAFSKE